MVPENTIGQYELIRSVIDKGICVTCGACVGICPYFHYVDGRVVVMDKCLCETGRCLQVCPRAGDPGSLDGVDAGGEGSGIGPYKKIMMARAGKVEVREKAQYGGTVSAILIGALEKGVIRSAVLTDRGNGASPAGRVAKDESHILENARSRYAASGGLAALNRAIGAGEEKLALVGLPCQMEALALMGATEPDGKERVGRISLKIGLFCTWALDYRGLNAYLNGMGVRKQVQKYDIPPPPSQIFRVLSGELWKDVPLEKVRPFIQKGCSLCQDMTSEWADLSVGLVEGREGWNTLVVRSDAGSEVIEGAVEEGILELEDLPQENFDHLAAASANKREKALRTKEREKGV